MQPYQPGIPTGTVNLDVDYQNLQNNFAQLDAQFTINHIAFSNTSGVPPVGVNGYHTVVNLVPSSTTVSNPPNNQPVAAPIATPGYGQLFSAQIQDGINLDEALYWLTGGNRLIQLTRNLQPTAANNGFTCLPGGFILQWGQVTPIAIGLGMFITQAFNFTFPSAVFAMFTQLSGSDLSSGAGTVQIRTSTLSTTSFEWKLATNSDKYTGFWWAALGI